MTTPSLETQTISVTLLELATHQATLFISLFYEVWFQGLHGSSGQSTTIAFALGVFYAPATTSRQL